VGYLPDLRVILIRGQGECIVDEAQTLTIRILNCTQRPMDLSLMFDNTISQREQFLWIGVVSKQLGKLESHQTYDIQLQLVPLTCGLKVNELILIKPKFPLFFFLAYWWFKIDGFIDETYL
jgi:hypothetical protein